MVPLDVVVFHILPHAFDTVKEGCALRLICKRASTAIQSEKFWNLWVNNKLDIIELEMVEQCRKYFEPNIPPNSKAFRVRLLLETLNSYADGDFFSHCRRSKTKFREYLKFLSDHNNNIHFSSNFDCFNCQVVWDARQTLVDVALITESGIVLLIAYSRVLFPDGTSLTHKQGNIWLWKNDKNENCLEVYIHRYASEILLKSMENVVLKIYPFSKPSYKIK